jgi:4-amino-4-deoxy-L-arabinose transferase-like glycosyltransferase
MRRLLEASLAVALLGLLLYLPALGAADFVGDDEALDAGFVREVAGGEWLFPVFNGEFLPPKPPLFYWLAAVAAKATGSVDEWSVRVPSALFASATLAATMACGRWFVGATPALLAAALLAVMPTFHTQARIGRADMTMAFFVTACLLVYGTGAGELPRGRRWLFHALLGLATLAKGAAALGLVAFVLAADAALGRDSRKLRSLVDPSVIAFIVIGGGWYALAIAHWGQRFVEDNLLGENLRHFLGGGIGSGRRITRNRWQPFAHVIPLFTGTFPWGLLLFPAAARWWRTPADASAAGERFLVAWLGSGFVFFSLAPRKSPYYLLPILPPLALAVASWLCRALGASLAGEAPWRDLRTRPALAAMVFAGSGAAIIAIAGGGPGPLNAVALAARERPVPCVAAAAVFAGSVVAAARAGFHRRFGAVASLAWAAMAATLLLRSLASGPLARSASLAPFARAVSEQVPADGRIFFFEMSLPKVVFYSGRTIPTIDGSSDPGGTFYLIVPAAMADHLPAEWRARSQVAASGRGRVFTRRTMEIRLLSVASSPRAKPMSSEEPGGKDL